MAILRQGKYAAVGALVFGITMVMRTLSAQAQQPVPFKYTDTSVEPDNADDAYWERYFGADFEVVLHSASFVAHLKIGRPSSTQVVAVLFTPRLCHEVASGDPSVSQCPAVLTTFRETSRPERKALEQPICLIHRGAKPPTESDVGFNTAQATYRRENDESVLVFSAAVGGQLLSDCTVTVPLGRP